MNTENPVTFRKPHSSLSQYRIEAHLAAQLNFHYKTGQEVKTVLRRYQDLVFQEENVFEDYRYPFSTGTTIQDERAKLERGGSPTEGDMAIESGEAGVTYEFLGWIQAKED